MDRFFIYPSINIDDLMMDSELKITDNTISLKG